MEIVTVLAAVAAAVPDVPLTVTLRITPVALMLPLTSSVSVGVVVPMPILPALSTNNASVFPALIRRGETVEPRPVCRLNKEPVPLLLASVVKENKLSVLVPVAQLKVVVKVS